MPTANEILGLAARIANEWRWLAIVWHLVAAAAIVGALLGFRPSQRFVGIGASAPLMSVGALAFWSGNPFNGTVFALLSVMLVYEATRLDRRPVVVAWPVAALAGSLLVVFGLTYPHFLITESWWEYLYASPFALVPCPTLAAVAGVSLMFGSFRSRRWAYILAIATMVYGLIGVVVLGVAIDAVLIAGAVFLFAAGWRTTDRRAVWRPSAADYFT